MSNGVVYPIRLSESEYQKLDTLAKTLRRTRADVLRLLIAEAAAVDPAPMLLAAKVSERYLTGAASEQPLGPGMVVLKETVSEKSKKKARARHQVAEVAARVSNKYLGGR